MDSFAERAREAREEEWERQNCPGLEEITWRAKVVKLLGIRRVMESHYYDREDFKRTCLGGPNEDWTDPFLGIHVVVSSGVPSTQLCDCTYWEHEGLEF